MKYIDSEKLIAEIERRRDSALERQKNLKKIGQETVLNEMIAAKLNGLLSFIDSLQQEQPPLPGIENPGTPGKDFIPVEWVDACEMYGKWKIVKLDQPEVDLEKEEKKWYDKGYKDATDKWLPLISS